MPVRTSTISTNSLLLVHGKGFKPPEEALSDLCAAALRAGVQRDYPEYTEKFDKASLHMAYYGDLTNELLLGQGREYDHQVDLGDRQNALNELRAIEDMLRMWDPIGVIAGTGVMEKSTDEYDSYAPGVLKQLLGGADAETLARHLNDLAIDQIGLTRALDEDREFARRLISWWKSRIGGTNAP